MCQKVQCDSWTNKRKVLCDSWTNKQKVQCDSWTNKQIRTGRNLSDFCKYYLYIDMIAWHCDTYTFKNSNTLFLTFAPAGDYITYFSRKSCGRFSFSLKAPDVFYGSGIQKWTFSLSVKHVGKWIIIAVPFLTATLCLCVLRTYIRMYGIYLRPTDWSQSWKLMNLNVMLMPGHVLIRLFVNLFERSVFEKRQRNKFVFDREWRFWRYTG